MKMSDIPLHISLYICGMVLGASLAYSPPSAVHYSKIEAAVHMCGSSGVEQLEAKDNKVTVRCKTGALIPDDALELHLQNMANVKVQK